MGVGKQRAKAEQEKGQAAEAGATASPQKAAKAKRRAAAGGGKKPRKAAKAAAAGAAGDGANGPSLEERMESRLAQIEEAVSIQAERSQELIEKLDGLIAASEQGPDAG